MTEDVVYSVFLIIPEISHSDISGVTKKAPCEAPVMHGSHACKGISDSILHTFVAWEKSTLRAKISTTISTKRGTHKHPYMERLHDIKTLYKKFQKALELEIEMC